MQKFIGVLTPVSTTRDTFFPVSSPAPRAASILKLDCEEGVWPGDVGEGDGRRLALSLPLELAESAVADGLKVPEVTAVSDVRVVVEPVSCDVEAVVVSSLGLGGSFEDFLATLYHSLGISPIAIAMLPTSPTKAAVTADMGSQGCSSVSCSCERYLGTC